MENKEGKKEDRRVRRTKKMLTQALTELLQQKQLKEITVKELTELADMNRGTFYLYYKDIFDMLEKIEDELFAQLNAIVALHAQEPVNEQTNSILRDLFHFISDNREMCRVLLSPHGDMLFLHRLNNLLYEKCLNFTRESAEGFAEADFDYHFSFVIFGCAGVIRAWLSRDCPESPEEMAEMTNRMLLQGSLK